MCRVHILGRGYNRCIYEPNMKFLCLNLWIEKRCTDNDTNANNANDNRARRTKHDCVGSFGVTPNEPKSKQLPKEMPTLKLLYSTWSQLSRCRNNSSAQLDKFIRPINLLTTFNVTKMIRGSFLRILEAH